MEINEFTDYPLKVINGEIVAGELLRLTCKRFLDWFERDDIYFDEDAARRPINFISKLKFWEGEQFVGKPFILQDWQKFMVHSIFGWKRKNNNKRVIRHAYIQIARKCGKTSLTAALGLYGLIADGETGAEVDIVAPSAEQSRIGFKHAKNLAATINRNNVITIRTGLIEFNHTNSRFRIMSSDAKFGDGFNPSIGIIDEYHAFVDNRIPNLLTGGMGMRQNPLMIYITTAGFNLYSPCKEYRDMCADILHGLKQDDTIFPLIYEMDKDDNWEDNKNWKKCCPALYNTVDEDYMFDQLNKARNNPIEEVDIKTKNFNMWCSGDVNWISDEIIKKSSKSFEIEDFMEYDEKLKKYVMPSKYYCYAGLDLAADSDFTSLSILIPVEVKKNYFNFYFKTYLFVPSDSLKYSRIKQLYKKWQQHDEIIVCDGNVQDYDIILNKILEIRSKIPIIKLAYDKWNSTAVITNAELKGLKTEPFYQSQGNYNSPLKNMYRQFQLGKIIIDNNEAVRWCFSNVSIHEDRHENKMPQKKGKRFEKIDAVVSMLMAFGVMINDKYCKANYEFKNDKDDK